MKKITLLLLFLFISLSGYSQMALETFESPAAPTGTVPLTWNLAATASSGSWAIFENNSPTTVGTAQHWGTNAFAAGLGVGNTTCANVSREQIGAGNTSADYLATPHILIPLNGELHFFTRMFTSGDQGTIYQIRVAPAPTAVQTDPTAYTALAQQWTETTLTTTYNVYEEKIVDLSAWAGQTVYVSFVKIFTQPDGNIGGDRWLVDNASIDSKCLVPTGLLVNGITVNGASLNWANPSGATSWEIEVVLATAAPTGVGVVYNGTLPYPLTGLLPNTAYKYYVRALCGTGYVSDWSAVSPTFTTGTAPPECGGNFTDPGGSSADYANNANVTTTICPTNPGDQVTITFTSFALENNFDFLKIYDGDNASATLLGNFTGATLPPSFTSSAASGCLTFVFTSDFTGVDTGWVTNITCAPAPTCSKPNNLTTNTVLSTTANFGWTQPANPDSSVATAWQVIALPCGSPTPTAATPGWIDTTSNPYSFTGLTSGTCYNFYVRAICSTTDSSLISAPISITTQVAPPICGGNFVDSGGSAANYAVNENITTTICPVNPGDLVTVTFTSFFTEANWDGLYVYDGNAVTPGTLLPSANPPGNVPGGLAGSYWGNLTGVNLPGPFTSTSADGCLTFVFRSDGSITDPGWLANVTCAPAPTCRKPITLSTSALAPNSVNFTWVQPANPDNSVATAWQVLALPCGSPTPTASTPGWIDTTNNPYSFAGLTPATCYDLYVRAICSTTDSSVVAGPTTITTPATCSVPTNLISTSILSTSANLGWTQPANPDGSTSTAWQVIALPCGSPTPTASTPGWINTTVNPYTFTGLTSATCYDLYVMSVCSPTDSSLAVELASITTQVAPPVCGGNFVDNGGAAANYANSSNVTTTICPTNTGDVVTVTFTSFFTEATWDGLYVYDGNAVTPGALLATANPPGNVPGGLAGSYWGNLTANLPGPFTSSSADGCLTFVFRSDASVNNPGWVANVTCSPAPACPKPNTLTATNLTSTSALLGWTELNPSVTQWQVYVVLQGQPAPLPTTTTGWVTVSTNPALFTGLTSGTQYTFYVRSICPDGSTSLWSNGNNFSTLIINDECSGALFAPVNSSAECAQITAGTLTGATASTVPLAAPCVGNADDDVWFQFIATNSYLNVSLQSIVGSTTNLNFAAYSGSCGTLTQIFCSAANAVSGVINNLTVGQTYYIRVYSNGSTPATVNFNLCISTPSTCPSASTVCSLTGYANTTGVTSLGTIGCLFTSPNPAYFTIQVATSGAINYTLTQSTQPPVAGVPGPANIDVDYAAWGPFTDQTAACNFIGSAQPFAAPGIGVPVTQQTGCSYSAAPTETLNIANAVAGQYYIILITNFSNQAGYISLQQNNLPDPNSPPPGVGTTNCCPSAAFAYNPVTYCKQTGAINPVAIISSGSVAGVFTSSPAGLVFANTTTGEVDLAASAPGSYIVTNTVAATASCAIKTSTSTIQIVEPVTASFTYDPTIVSYCNILYTTPQPATLTGATGGTFSASPNGGLFLDVTTGAFTPSLSSPGVYTVTYSLPGTGACIASNPSAIVTITDAPAPTFTQVQPICPGDALAPLPTSSNDAPPITGVWTPAIDNTQTTTYTFTPDAGQCAETTTMTINVGSTTPTFDPVAPICPGAPLADLPTTSTNGIIGTWAPALDNLHTTTYTFTPTSGGCVGSTSLTIQVLVPSIVPTFNAIPPICPNGVINALPTTSLNGIAGIWTPALDNTQTTTYTFTPNTGQCALDTTLTIIVNPPLVVSVNSPTFCPGGSTTMVATPAIPGTYTYTWTVPPGVTNPGNVASFTTTVAGTYTVVIDQVSSFCNTDFESPLATGASPNLVNETLVPCWDTTAPDGIIEIWPPGFEGVTAYSGNQLIELNANVVGTLFQDFTVIPGTTMSISFAHRGRNGIDVVGVEIGPVGGPYVSLGNFSDGNTAWALHTVNYTIPAGGGNNYTLRFVSVSSTGGSPSIGNLLDSISVSALSCTSQPAVGIATSGGTTPVTTFTYTTPVCQNATTNPLPDTTATGFTTGGTFTSNPATGIDINATTGEITLANTTDGTYVITYTTPADPTNCQLGGSTDFTIVISPLVNPVLGFSYTTPVCQNATTNPLPTFTTGTLTGGTFTSNPATGIDINATTGEITLANTTAGTYVITYATAGADCLFAGSTDFTIVINPIVNPVLGFSYTTPICQNASATLSPTLVAGFTSGGTFTSTTGLSINGTTGVINLANSTAGTYTITYTSNANTASCLVSGTNTATIVINPVITPVTTFNYDTPFCASSGTESPNLGAGFTTGGTFSSTAGLTIDATTGVIDLSSTPGSYTITYSVAANASTCQVAATGTTQIVIIPPVSIVLNGGCQSISYILTATGSFNLETASYVWHDANGVIVGNTQSITVPAVGTYTVTVNVDGCDTVSAPFNVASISCTIQKGISVNGDGLNDTFDLTGFDVKKLTIFNRLGTKVYSQNNYINSWGGKSDAGDELPDGTYFYVIDINSGGTKTGWIYINRAQ